MLRRRQSITRILTHHLVNFLVGENEVRNLAVQGAQAPDVLEAEEGDDLVHCILRELHSVSIRLVEGESDQR